MPEAQQFSNEMMQAFQYYEEHPVAFCEEVLGVQLDQWQCDAMDNLQKYHFLAIRSGSGVGKTCLLSLLTLWFLSTKPFCKIPTTAPTQHQLYDLLWSEHHKWISRSKFLQDLLVWTQTRIGVKGHEPEWYAVARTAQASPSGEVAEGLQGFHCHSQDTEVLTDTGWKRFYDVDIDTDKVLSLDKETGFAAYYQATELIKEHYEGDMFTVRHQNLDFCVTPNHKMLYKVRSHGKLSDWRLEEIQNVHYRHWYVNNAFKWEGHHSECFYLPEFVSTHKYFPVVALNAELWFYFLGLYFAEGWCDSRGQCVYLAQAGDDIMGFDLVTQSLGFNAHCRNNKIEINSMQLCNHLKDFDSYSIDKKIPQYVRDASPVLIRAFLDGYVNQKSMKVYYTSSSQLADDIQELIFKAGGKASVRRYSAESNQKKPYCVAEYVDDTAYLTIRGENIKRVFYNGDVYCLNVPPKHLLFTRRDGFCMWSGNSEDNLLFIVDEASGAPDAVFPAIEGALTGPNAYCILAGNPTKTDGYFADIFNKPQLGKLYKKMHVSCYDSPRVEERYIEMMKERYGEKHPIFLIKVLGEFATGSINTLIPVSYIEAMQAGQKERSMSPTMSTRIGLDVGRSNAASVLTVRQGFNVLVIAEKHKPGRITDTNEVCQWVIEYINAYNPDFVMVDAIGIGAGVFDNLELLYGNKIVAVIGGQKSTHPERFSNLRAEGYWDLRELIPKLWCKEWPQRLITELSDIRQKENVRKDIVQVESKKDMMHRSMRSPDYADSLMYAFLSPEACLAERIMSPFSFESGYAAVNTALIKEDVGSSWGFLKDTPVDRWVGLRE